MKTVQRIVKNTVVLLLSDVISKVLGFFYVMYTARYLGAGGFGVLSFALAFTGIFCYFSDLGLSTLTVREVTRDKSLASKYLGNIAVMKIILVVIIFGLIALTINFLNYSEQTIKVVYLVALSIIFTIFTNMFYSIFQAFEKMEYQSIGRILNSILMLSGALFAISRGYDVVGFASIYFIVSVFVLGYSFVICVWKFVLPRLEINFEVWKVIIKQSLPFGLTILFFTLYYRIDMVMLSLMKGNEAVGWYSAAHQLVFIFAASSGPFLSSFFPITSRLYQSSKEALIHSSERAFGYLLMIALPVGAGTTILASRFIYLIYGAGYISSIIALQILIWTGVIIFVDIFGNLLGSIDKQIEMAKVSGICLLVNVVLNLLLIPKYSYIGASIAMVITNIVGIFGLYIYIIRSGYQLSNNFLLKKILKVATATVIMGIYIIFFKNVNLLLVVPSSAILYFLSFYLLKGFDSEDKKLFEKVFIRGNNIKTFNTKKKLFEFWDKDKEYSKLAREANLVLKEERLDMLKYINQGDLVLDVGCGGSENGRYISQFAYYVGTDISSMAIKMGMDYKNENFDLVRSNVEMLPFIDNSFDVVLSTHSLEHFLNPKKVIDEMYRVCKKTGKIILISPAWDFPLSLPPSLGRLNRLQKLRFIFKKSIKQLCLLFKKYFSPIIINNPSIFDDGYSQDNDTVYVVSIREIENYLTKWLNTKLLFIKTGYKWSKKIPLFKYWGTNVLFIMVEK